MIKQIVGLDEVGRGSLAGPVVAGAVIIKDFSFFKFFKIRDSKKLSTKKREKIYKTLTNHPAIEWKISKVSEKIIDKINILEATKLAMKRAVLKFEKVDSLIIDGNFKINLPIPQKSIIKADEKILSCAIASIIAKVSRDKIMEKYHQKYPQYGFDKHKGYPTEYHIKMLKNFGISDIHRKTYKPIKNFIY